MNITDINDTICAVATPAGHSALAILRLSGDRSWQIADAVCDRPISKPSRIKNGLAFRAVVTSESAVIDQAVLLLFHAPKSYTGQDMVEFSVHGSPAIVEQLLQRLHEEGARFAEPGEFSFRAYWNGKITLDQAEGVAALISAQDEASRKGAFRLLDGVVGTSAKRLQERIIDVSAKLELMLDFSEDETPLFSFEALRESLQKVLCELKEITDKAQDTLVSSEGIRIALAGPPNAGKSSLLNRLLSREKAIVSHMPGTTRDIVEGELSVSGRRIKLFDTAGLRDSENIIEREGVRRSRQVHRNADLVLWVHPGDRQKISKEFYSTSGEHWLILNKNDLLSSDTRKRWRKTLDGVETPHFFLSAKTGAGVSQLHRAIADWIEKSYNYAVTDAVLPMNQRHLDVYRKTAKLLQKSMCMLSDSTAPEIIAQELKTAVDTLGEITGTSATEATLRKIFSGFCIGK